MVRQSTEEEEEEGIEEYRKKKKDEIKWRVERERKGRVVRNSGRIRQEEQHKREKGWGWNGEERKGEEESEETAGHIFLTIPN